MDNTFKFYISKKIQELFLSKWKFALWTVGVTFASFLYSFGTSFFIEVSVSQTNLNYEELFFFVNIFFATLFLLLDIFPFYNPMPYFFPRYYPVKGRTKILVSTTFSLFRYFLLFELLIFLFLILINSQYQIENFITSILTILGFYAFNRVVKNIFDYDLIYKKTLIISSLLTIITCNYLIYQYFLYNSFLTLLFSLLSFIIPFFCFVFAELNKLHKSAKTIFLPFKNTLLKILASRNIGVAFSIGMIFKGLMLFAASLSLQLKNNPLYDSYFFTWLFLSPLMVFTYVGLNFFGFNRALFLTHALHDSKVMNMVKVYTKSMLILTAIDSIFFWLFISINDLYSISNIALYYSLTILLFFIGFYFSVKKPIFKEKFLTLDFKRNKGANIDFIAVIISSILFVVLYLSKVNILFLSLVFVISFLTLIFLFKYRGLDMTLVIQNAFKKIKIDN